MGITSTPLKGVELRERTDADIEAAVSAQDLGEEYAQVIDQLTWLRNYAAEHSLSQKQIQMRAGLSTSVLSQMYAGNYPGNYIMQARKVQKFRMDLEKKAIYGGAQEFLETSISKGLFRICEKTRYNRRIQFIQSEEQMQKTRSLNEYTHRNNSGRTVMVTLQPAGTSSPLSLFVRDLAYACGVKNAKGIKSTKLIDLHHDIDERLVTCDLVIIDEVHMLAKWPAGQQQALLDMIRIRLHQDGARGVVMVWTNTDALDSVNDIRKATGYNLGQFLGRMRNEPISLNEDDILEDDVRMFVERYFKPRATTVRKLHDITSRPRLGHFGLLCDILQEAWSISKTSDRTMDDELVLDTARATMEDINSRKDMYS